MSMKTPEGLQDQNLTVLGTLNQHSVTRNFNFMVSIEPSGLEHEFMSFPHCLDGLRTLSRLHFRLVA